MNPEKSLRRQILAHRGIWDKHWQQNSLESITDALTDGFGVEIDLRDRGGELVLSHDVASAACPSFHSLCDNLIAKNITHGSVLAVNVKADGLIPLINEHLHILSAANVFFFDMSFPQEMQYRGSGLRTAVRLSEYEQGLLFSPNKQSGDPVWLDGFESDWWLTPRSGIERIKSRSLYVVSPELHGRDPEPVWSWAADKLSSGWSISICTDHPRLVERRLKR